MMKAQMETDVERMSSKELHELAEDILEAKGIKRTNVNWDMNLLCRRILSMCKKRGWPLDWSGRGVYLHLETSELIEAMRGKGGDPIEEAGDVLMVLMSMTAAASLDFNKVVEGMEKKLTDLETKPPYPGEYRNPASTL